MTTLLLLVSIAEDHKALLHERFRVIDAPDAPMPELEKMIQEVQFRFV